MNIKIMIEKSFTYACVLSNKCRNRPAIIAKRLAAVLDAASWSRAVDILPASEADNRTA